jgi:hypothetical protein
MTVTTTANSISYTGNGTTTAFAFPYIFFAPSDLVVTLNVTATSVPVVPAPVLNGAATYDYTITGDGTGGEYASGATVTFNTAPLAAHTVLLVRSVPATQTVTLIDNTKFPADTINSEFDKLTILAQQSAFLTSTSLQIPSYEVGFGVTAAPAASRANKLLLWDATGNLSSIDPTTLIGGAVPAGPASGDLAGSYPGPSIKPSVGLTGSPTAPTAAAATNTTQIATTAFVTGSVATATTGALKLYSEQVLGSSANQIVVSFPSTARLVELVWEATVTPSSDPTLSLQGMNGATPNATTGYGYVRTIASAASGAATISGDVAGSQTQVIYAAGFITRGKVTLTTPSKGWGVGQVMTVTSVGVRVSTQLALETAGITGLDGYRLVCATNNFAAGSFLRCLVVA